MAKILNAKKRKCDVLTNGVLPELNFVTGPVYNCRLTTDQIVRLVSNGRKVMEINPNNPNEKVLLKVATCSKSAFGEVVDVPKVEEPVVPIPIQVVMTPSKQTEETDPHKIFLKNIGKTEDEWRRLSKADRKRLKLQYENKSANTQNVIEQTEKITTTPAEAPTNEVVENNQVVEAINEETTTKETPIEGSVPEEERTEEAVAGADM